MPNSVEKVAIAVLTVITELSAEKARPGDHGTRICPVCSGNLEWAIIAGARRGLGFRLSCETPDCISAMS
jgi:hypothetical protein